MLTPGPAAGPADAGKSEVVRELANATGHHCVAFAGGPAMDARFMGSFLAGIAQCGAWACVDDIDHLHVGVLSVMAQQLASLQNALRVRTSLGHALWPGSGTVLECLFM